MDALYSIFTWLSDHEAGISAVAAILAIAVILFTGFHLLLRRGVGEALKNALVRPGRRSVLIAAVAAVLLVLAGFVAWLMLPDDLTPEIDSGISTEASLTMDSSAHSEEALTVPGFGGPPAIAVLAFDNLSGDPEQEYFADGIAEDLITRLSTWRNFPVIARNSSFTYKGKPVDVKQVSRELGARYLVEGSVRKVGDRVRIAAQLIDATTGHHVWAETYDRELRDIFALQDEITQAIVGSMYPELWKSEEERVIRSNPRNLGAWDAMLRGWWHFRRFTKHGNAEARSLFQRAIDADPLFAEAFAALAFTHLFDADFQWSDSPERSVAEGYQAARRAVKLDNGDAIGHMALGSAYSRLGEQDESISAFEFAVQLNPSLAAAYRLLGMYLALAGRPEEAIANLEKAIRLSPQDPWMFECLYGMAIAHVAAGRYEDAVDWALRSRQLRPEIPTTYLVLAGSYVQLERIDEARSALEEALRLNPGYSVSGLRLVLAGADASYAELIIDALRKAGLPE